MYAMDVISLYESLRDYNPEPNEIYKKYNRRAGEIEQEWAHAGMDAAEAFRGDYYGMCRCEQERQRQCYVKTLEEIDKKFNQQFHDLLFDIFTDQ